MYLPFVKISSTEAMKSVILLLAVVAVARGQYGAGGFGRPFGRPGGVFGGSAGSFGASASSFSYGSAGGFGSGGNIIFPSNVRPSVNIPVRPFNQGRPVQPSNPFPVRPSPHLQSQFPTCSVDVVDHQAFGSRYHFSWCHDGFQNYTQPTAINYCSSLGQGWKGISIETPAENALVSSIIGGHRLDWIWTGGVKNSAGSFYWPSGAPFSFSDFSHTGLDGLPQPDNRENNNEQCLAILNNFYNDGIKWHDIGCHHEKPIICEYA